MNIAIRALFVDDSEDLLFIACKFLGKIAPDIEVETSESAKDALVKLEEGDFDIIVCDYQMPVMDGLEFLEVVRNSGNEIPIIIFTGRGREEVAIQALNLGATHYLKKGGEQKSQFAQLVHQIRTAVSHRRSDIARDQSERLAEEESKKAQTYLEISRVMFVALDAKGRINFVNSHTCAVMGYEEEELIGKDWFALAFPKTIQPSVRSVFNDLMSGRINQLHYYENQIITKLGEERHIAWYNTYLTDETGNINGVLTSGEDITERKILDRVVRESEERFRLFMENSTEGFILWDSELKLQFINQAALKIFPEDAKTENLIGKHLFEISPSIKESQQWMAYEQVLKTGEPFKSTDYIPDEKFGNIILDFRLFRVGSGLGFIFTDVTEQRVAEKKLRKSEEALRLAFDNSQIGMVWLHPDGKFKRVNHAYCNMLGYSEEELLQKTFQEVTHPEDYHIGEDIVRRMLTGEIDHGVIEKRYITKDGMTAYCKMTTSLIRNHQGDPIHFSTQADDITDIRHSHWKLQKRKKEMTCFLEISELAADLELSMDEILQKMIETIPTAWNYLEITCGRIIVDNKIFSTSNFRETQWKQSADIIVRKEQQGVIEKYYLEERLESDEGPFLKEERGLIEGIARQIANAIERKRLEDDLDQSKRKEK
ncbi:MAG: PAS domain S-box protein [Candidatus Thorarchaeota archaeon]